MFLKDKLNLVMELYTMASVPLSAEHQQYILRYLKEGYFLLLVSFTTFLDFCQKVIRQQRIEPWNLPGER